MTKNIFFSSDHHLGHNSIIKFKDSKGEQIRKFSSVEEHDDYIITKHNEKVKPQDKCYFVGDFAINLTGLAKLKLMNGTINLIRGNHDIFKTKQYLDAGFKEVYGVRVFTEKDMGKDKNFIASHIPLHPESMYRYKRNVHGHLHLNLIQNNYVKFHDGNEVKVQYINVCMEHLNDYEPRHIDDITKHFRINKV